MKALKKTFSILRMRRLEFISEINSQPVESLMRKGVHSVIDIFFFFKDFVYLFVYLRERESVSRGRSRGRGETM